MGTGDSLALNVLALCAPAAEPHTNAPAQTARTARFVRIMPPPVAVMIMRRSLFSNELSVSQQRTTDFQRSVPAFIAVVLSPISAGESTHHSLDADGRSSAH